MTRQGFGLGLLDAAKKDHSIMVLTGNLAYSTGLGPFMKKYPSRLIDCGVAEQSLAGIAAGLALGGKRVVMTSFAVFSPGRNWDFLRTQIVLNRLPVLIVGSHAGLATGADGATHQALEDVALMRSLPGVMVISPGDDREARQATLFALKQDCPVYLRLARTCERSFLPVFTGKSVWLAKGSDATIVCTGILAWTALKAAKILAPSFKVGVLHVPVIKPLSLPPKVFSKPVFSVEDHSAIGGLGSALAEQAALHQGFVYRFGTHGFGQSGTPEQLYHEHGLDPDSIALTIAKEIKKFKRKK